MITNIAIAQNPDWVTEKRSGGGKNSPYQVLTNWSKGWMEFEASATADMKIAKNSGQAEYLSKEAARMLAYEKAAEFLGGVTVEAMQGVDKGLIKADVLTVKSSNMVRNAIIISDTCIWKKGQAGETYPWATVKIGVLLYGDKNNQSVMNLILGDIVSGLKQSGYQSFQPKSPLAKNVEVKMNLKPITGIIIDARGHNIRPSISPLVLVQGKGKKVVYSGSSVSSNYATTRGIAGFVRREEQALLDDRLSVNSVVNPIIVKVASVVDNTIYLTPENAGQLVAADMKYNVLDECRVMILVD